MTDERRLYTAWRSARIGRTKARKEATDLRDTLTLLEQSLSLIGERAEQAEAERDQALVDLETAKGWRDQLKAERNEYRRANAQLQELATLRAGERDRLKATVDRVRAVHHLIEWVSLSDVCHRHHWFRTVGPTAENIAVADVCPDCRPRRYMNCVCADDECPVLAALDED